MRDRDQLLIEQMLAPPPLEDARGSLEYWRRRRKMLPLYRLAARREAKQMTAWWHETVRAAEIARFDASPVGQFLKAIGASQFWVRLVRDTRRWSEGPDVKGVAAGALAMVLLVIATLAVLLAQIARMRTYVRVLRGVDPPRRPGRVLRGGRATG